MFNVMVILKLVVSKEFTTHSRRDYACPLDASDFLVSPHRCSSVRLQVYDGSQERWLRTGRQVRATAT